MTFLKEVKNMLKHIVMWRLMENACGHTREENMDIIQKGLTALVGVVPNLLSLEMGRDVIHSDMSYDMVLICTFPGRGGNACIQGSSAARQGCLIYQRGSFGTRCH